MSCFFFLNWFILSWAATLDLRVFLLSPHSWGCEPPTRCVLRCRWSRGCCPPRCWTAPCLDAAPQKEDRTHSVHIEFSKNDIWEPFYTQSGGKKIQTFGEEQNAKMWDVVMLVDSEPVHQTELKEDWENISAVTFKTTQTSLNRIYSREKVHALSFSGNHI